MGWLSGANPNVPATQNLIEDFNVAPDPNNRTILHDCWEAYFTAPFDGRELSSVQIYEGTLYMNSTYGAQVTTPEVENMQGTISFKAKKEWSGNMSVDLGVNNGSGTGFTLIQSFVLSSSYQTFTYDFSNYTGTAKHLVFRHAPSNGSAVNLRIDDLEYKSFCEPDSDPTIAAKDITVYSKQ